MTSLRRASDPVARPPALRDVVRDVLVVAHREDTRPLARALEQEGWPSEEVRGPYSALQREFPAHIRCLVNHANAWRRIAERDGLHIVAEADFVPVVGLAGLPLPFVPRPGQPAMAWLYSVGPVIYHVDEDGCLYGHNAGTVAYVLDGEVARILLSIFDAEMAGPDPGRYRAWEVSIPIELRRKRGVRCYIPFRMYGEHGGLMNQEHRAGGVRGWHQADVLAGRLAFLPSYARGSSARYRIVRAAAHLRGWYRLLAGRPFDRWWALLRSTESRSQRARIALRRMVYLCRWPASDGPRSSRL